MKAPPVLLTALLLLYLPAAIAQRPIWPAAAPEEEGLSSADLNAMFDYIQQHKTRVHSIQIIRHGRLIMDSYFYPFNASSRHDVASVTKSITSTVAGIAIDKQHITGIHNKMLSYFPEFTADDPRKQQITLEDLITMRSGFDCGGKINSPTVNADQRLAEARRSPDWIRTMFHMPMAGEPGQQFAYCNANCHLLSAIIARATGQSTFEFARQHLFGPLGITNVYWPADPKGVNYGWGDIQLHPYDMLRIGQLMLHRGKWEGRQIISTAWLDTATRTRVFDTGGSDRYGYYWWKPGDEKFADVFEAIGRGGQRITIWPSKDMVIVFTGGGFETSNLVSFIIKAIQSDEAIDPNPAAFKQLQALIKAATQPSAAHAPAKLPGMAATISGKTFSLSSNTMDLTSLRFNFDKKAVMHLKWAGHDVTCDMGLDGRERFSHNPLVKLSQACTGKWTNDTTLQVTLDLVGAINLYNIEYRFSKNGKAVWIKLREGTGLNDEEFTGTVDGK